MWIRAHGPVPRLATFTMDGKCSQGKEQNYSFRLIRKSCPTTFSPTFQVSASLSSCLPLESWCQISNDEVPSHSLLLAGHLNFQVLGSRVLFSQSLKPDQETPCGHVFLPGTDSNFYLILVEGLGQRHPMNHKRIFRCSYYLFTTSPYE